MPRSHGKLSTTVWTDEDHRSLGLVAQWLFAYLLAHPKVTICGVLDVSLARLARQCGEVTPEAVEAGLHELVAVGHIKVDWETEELMFRSFTRHDLSPTRWNKNLTAGFWRAWRGIESADLRAEVCRQMPAALWDKVAEAAPEDAVRFRRSLRLEPQTQPRSEPQEPVRSEPTSPSPSTVALHPSPSRSLLSSQSDPLPAEGLTADDRRYEPHPPSGDERAHRDEVVGSLREQLAAKGVPLAHGRSGRAS